MNFSDRLYKLLRWVGILIWLGLGIGNAYVIMANRGHITPRDTVTFFGAFLIYGPMFYGLSIQRLGLVWRLIMAAIAVLCSLVMLYIRPGSGGDGLVTILTYQLAFVLPLRWAVMWVILQTIAMSATYLHLQSQAYAWINGPIWFGFDIYALITAYVAHIEMRSRRDLAMTNSELRATQYLLASSSRTGERVRISRELHDVLGHDLTALSLHLEVALNSSSDSLGHVEKAQLVVKALLNKVREVVNLTRSDDQQDVVAILRSMVESVPQLQIHLNVADRISVADPGRAHTLVRCVQEIITNTLKHSGARNLWIDATHSDTDIHIQAWDDGHGAVAFQWGNGLTGMQERLSEFGGNLTVIGKSKQGFELNITLPLDVLWP